MQRALPAQQDRLDRPGRRALLALLVQALPDPRALLAQLVLRALLVQQEQALPVRRDQLDLPAQALPDPRALRALLV